MKKRGLVLVKAVESGKRWKTGLQTRTNKPTYINPFKPNGFFHPYYLEESILHLRVVRLIFSS